jgi:hypothetical protein
MKKTRSLILNKSGKPIGEREVEIYFDEPPYFLVCYINGRPHQVFPAKPGDRNEGA